MSNLSYRIPRYADAGVAFLGVELKDAWLLIASLFMGIIVGGFMKVGWMAFIGIPLSGYYINRALIEWQSQHLPGFIRTYLFSKGIRGYSSGITSQQVIYVGDAVAIYPGSVQLIDRLITRSKEKKHGA